MELERLSLADVGVYDDSLKVSPNFDGVVIDPYDYSQFKYGNGLVSNKFGRLLAKKFFSTIGAEIDDVCYITSSAYKYSPPAANSLIAPFLEESSVVITHTTTPKLSIDPFKIDRSVLTDGDYAKMNLAQREMVAEKNGLKMPRDLDLCGAEVIVIDDIYITGTHEKTLVDILSKAGVDRVFFLYILRAEDGTEPGVESLLNGTDSVDIDDIIKISSEPNFLPNARLCKFILSQSNEQIASFWQQVPSDVRWRIFEFCTGDGLYEKGKYFAAYRCMARLAVGDLSYSFVA